MEKFGKYLKTYDGDQVPATEFLKTIDQIKEDFSDGLSKSDIPIIIGRLMVQSAKIYKLDGQRKKALVIFSVFDIIEGIDEGEKDSDLEKILKLFVPPTIDAVALAMKMSKITAKSKSCCLRFFKRFKK